MVELNIILIYSNTKNKRKNSILDQGFRIIKKSPTFHTIKWKRSIPRRRHNNRCSVRQCEIKIKIKINHLFFRKNPLKSCNESDFRNRQQRFCRPLWHNSVPIFSAYALQKVYFLTITIICRSTYFQGRVFTRKSGHLMIITFISFCSLV